jgi:import receptor subunit TOM22
MTKTTTTPTLVSLQRPPAFAIKYPNWYIYCSESEISVESDYDLEGETLYERLSALKDIVPPSARLQVTNTVSTVTSFAKSSIAFSGKALWILSTSAFLLGVPWALAYAEEEQYIQMEREQGMIKGANEVSHS